ncbi:MAG: hypothetical protein GX675_04900 [Erysipelotrichaceae bacterium]|nr:hypothetical protein [Erysipelotrichaceae bacterium]
MKKLIKEELKFIEEIIESTKENEYANLLARKRKSRLTGYLLKLERKNNEII